MLIVPFSVLPISIYLISIVGVEVGCGEVWTKIKVPHYVWLVTYTHVGGCKLDFRFFLSIVRHASTQLRKPATRGMASQPLRTFERMDIFLLFC